MIAALLSVIYLSSVAFAGINKVLTDVTFEHDTQASTGQTTGVWLVRFCDRKSMSNWCVDGFIEYWADLCDDLLQDHGIMTGTVDLAKNTKLATRFSSPILEEYGVQLALFKDHGMYLTSVELPDDKDMSREQIKMWVLEGHASETKLPVPPEPTVMDALWEKLDDPDVRKPAAIAGSVIALVVVAMALKTLVSRVKRTKTMKRL